ncbi:c-type cytochrome [Thermaurantiacus sp.]
MDSYEWTRISGAVLTALIAVLGLSILTGYIYTPAVPAKRGFVVEGVVAEAEEAPAAEAGEPPIELLLASADPARGEAAFKKCAACHSIDKGGANGIGPNLYGIVGAKHAHIAGFGYSPALQALADKRWDWASLSEWLKNPRAAIPGNKMAFAGISKAQERADLLAYLNSKSDSPLPLPAPPAAAPEAAAAPAEEPATEQAAT